MLAAPSRRGIAGSPLLGRQPGRHGGLQGRPAAGARPAGQPGGAAGRGGALPAAAGMARPLWKHHGSLPRRWMVASWGRDRLLALPGTRARRARWNNQRLPPLRHTCRRRSARGGRPNFPVLSV